MLRDGFFGQCGPNLLVGLSVGLKIAICVECIFVIFISIIVYCTVNTVKINNNFVRHTQVTNSRVLGVQSIYPIYSREHSYLVGTSEATRAPNNELSFNQWLAGLIDGKGCFLVTTKDHTSCELTVDQRDESMVRELQSKLGGSIRLRSGNSLRWRLHDKSSMIDLVNRVNGEIRNSKRLLQLNHVCTILNIPCLAPANNTPSIPWLAGFWDVEGAISVTLLSKKESVDYKVHAHLASTNTAQEPKRGDPKVITISVTNRAYADLRVFGKQFGGNIYYDRAQNGFYRWSTELPESVKDIAAKFAPYSKSHKGLILKEQTKFPLV